MASSRTRSGSRSGQGPQRRPREEVGGAPITNDGVSIARRSSSRSPGEGGGELVKEVAKKTDDVAGDGTTTPPSSRRPWSTRASRNVAAGANRCR